MSEASKGESHDSLFSKTSKPVSSLIAPRAPLRSGISLRISDIETEPLKSKSISHWTTKINHGVETPQTRTAADHLPYRSQIYSSSPLGSGVGSDWAEGVLPACSLSISKAFSAPVVPKSVLSSTLIHSLVRYIALTTCIRL